MPKFDMNASVIRLGTGGLQKNDERGPRGGGSNAEPLGQRRGGLGMDRNLEQQRQQIRESMQALLPPKSDEVLKTIFVGNITEGCRGDAGIEELLRVAGNLRKWTRAIDADNKPCTFGFAEYEDSESLGTAAEVLKDIYVPVKKQPVKSNDSIKRDSDIKADPEIKADPDAPEEMEKLKLLASFWTQKVLLSSANDDNRSLSMMPPRSMPRTGRSSEATQRSTFNADANWRKKLSEVS